MEGWPSNLYDAGVQVGGPQNDATFFGGGFGLGQMCFFWCSGGKSKVGMDVPLEVRIKGDRISGWYP